MAAAAAAAPAAPPAATPGSTKLEIISVMSFNLLARCWVKPEWFPGVDVKTLVWEARVALNLKTITDAAPDVVCMQEVDEHSYPILKEKLAKAGYHLTDLAANHPSSAAVKNGTATAYSAKRWSQQPDTSMLIGGMGTSILNLPGFPLIVNIHLDRLNDGGAEQLEALWKVLGAHKRKECVVVGDTNVKQEDVVKLMPGKVIAPNGSMAITPNGSMCFAATQPAMVLDRLIAIGATVAPVPEGDQKWRDEQWAASQIECPAPVEKHAFRALALSSVLARYGSDHMPIQFHVFSA